MSIDISKQKSFMSIDISFEKSLMKIFKVDMVSNFLIIMNKVFYKYKNKLIICGRDFAFKAGDNVIIYK